jgi:peptide/nickel transport system substrate-binding protein
METTWTLKQGVKWADGTELTAKDIIFGWKIANDPEVPWSRPALARLIDGMDAPDDYTVVMQWRRVFPFADNPEVTTLDPLPVHILQSAYETDVQAFVNSPYWTREFVGLGPYRLASWEPGASMILAARDDYYGGRAKIDSITVRFITDANALVANLLSGAIDVQLPPSNLDAQNWRVLEAQWTDGSVLYNLDGTFALVGPNHRVPPFGQVPIRQALAYAIDREAVVDALFLPRSSIADAMVTPGSEKEKRLRDRITVYNYDPPRAQALLAENGWTRGGDGVLRNAQGQPFEFEYKASRQTEGTVIADMWKSIGLQPQIVVPSPTLMSDLEYQATVKGVESTGFGIGFGMWERRMHSSAIPVPETRWAGTNRRYYSNPELDTMIDRFTATLDDRERENIEGEMIRQVTRDAVLIPLYVASRASSIRKGITGIKPMAGNPVIVANYYNTWNILEWDRN